MDYAALPEKSIGCACRICNQMGFRFLESVYEKRMLIELERQGLSLYLASLRKGMLGDCHSDIKSVFIGGHLRRRLFH